jgi:hypothetical protein
LAFFSFMPIACAMSAKEGYCPVAEAGVSWGRRFQFGEGWHSSRNTVRFWNTITFQKERYARCYAFTTAYAPMIPLCNVC